jgi:nucleoside-diphosphate-sugar epimerase
MKVLVTGATGFVGRAVIAELDSRGIDRITVGGPNSTNADHSLDIGDAAAWRAIEVAGGGVDAVVHLAGIAHRFKKVDDDAFHSVNVRGVENSANFAVRVQAKQFLLFSSTLVYGRRSGALPITEEGECRPFDAYGRSKLEGEDAAKSVCESAGVGLTIFRPAPIVGEGSKGNFARLIRAIDNRKFVWVGSGDNLKSVVYVGDAAKAVCTVLEKGAQGTQVFNLAADPVRMKDIVAAIAGSLARKVPSIHLPAGPIRAVAKPAAFLFGERLRRLDAMLDTWLGDDIYANEKLRRVYGYKPGTPIAEAVGREVAHYLRQK